MNVSEQLQLALLVPGQDQVWTRRLKRIGWCWLHVVLKFLASPLSKVIVNVDFINPAWQSRLGLSWPTQAWLILINPGLVGSELVARSLSHCQPKSGACRLACGGHFQKIQYIAKSNGNYSTTVLVVLSPMYVSQVSSYLNLSDITLHLAVSLFDRTLAVVEVEEEQLQITAITCLHLAAKVWMTSFESVQSVRSS